MLPGIGIFGGGQLVRVLVSCLRAKGFKVEAIWSHNLESAQDMARELDIKLATDVIDRVLLEPAVQLIVIACPPHLHEQIATKACGIGKHVLCDCPPALSLDQMVSMKRAALNYPSLITILFNTLRFLPSFAKMKRLIADGFVGDINVINCNVFGDCLQGLDNYSIVCDDLMGGGLLATTGTHIIDIISFITGLRAKRVNGCVRNYHQIKDNVFGLRRITSDDFVTFQMEMKNSLCIANVTLNSHYFGTSIHEILVCGSKGYLVCRSGDLYGRLLTSAKEELLCGDSEDMSDNNLSAVIEAIKYSSKNREWVRIKYDTN
ncbi:unnamed protein product [Oppiella nova]|uniref:Uncharacterized protein n=1 Tax=Oppiella nova TaxID=334625 RepID=A0A7R9L969_9ACAR|nr:unnamed protein product [Oppiella nova]CAG2160015.1 unnamed protein product [Oppiella nova]